MTEADHLDRVVDALAEEFVGVFGRETITASVTDSHDLLIPERVQAYVPLLAHRFARERLRAIALVQDRQEHPHPRVLFVCTHDAGRSQLAGALLIAASTSWLEVSAVGTAPVAEVDPVVQAALAEVGIDASEAFPKPSTTELVEAADVVVTMGCGDACPVFPGRRYLDWELPDPAGLDLPGVRAIRDTVSSLVQDLLAGLRAPETAR